MVVGDYFMQEAEVNVCGLQTGSVARCGPGDGGRRLGTAAHGLERLQPHRTTAAREGGATGARDGGESAGV